MEVYLTKYVYNPALLEFLKTLFNLNEVREAYKLPTSRALLPKHSEALFTSKAWSLYPFLGHGVLPVLIYCS